MEKSKTGKMLLIHLRKPTSEVNSLTKIARESPRRLQSLNRAEIPINLIGHAPSRRKIVRTSRAARAPARASHLTSVELRDNCRNRAPIRELSAQHRPCALIALIPLGPRPGRVTPAASETDPVAMVRRLASIAQGLKHPAPICADIALIKNRFRAPAPQTRAPAGSNYWFGTVR